MWSQMLLSTHAFLKSISNVSGKDIGPLIKQWVYPLSQSDLCLQTEAGMVEVAVLETVNKKENKQIWKAASCETDYSQIKTNIESLSTGSHTSLEGFSLNHSYAEIRAVWWNSSAVLPSTERGTCWSWRSVRTTHHLELRNMWWVLQPCALSLCQDPSRLKLSDFFCYVLCSVSLQGPIKVTVQELDGSFNHMLQIEENSLKHDIPCHSKSRRCRTLRHSPLPGLCITMDTYIIAVIAPENHALLTLRCATVHPESIASAWCYKLGTCFSYFLCKPSIRFDGVQPFSNLLRNV